MTQGSTMPNIIAGIATPESLRANPRIPTINEPSRQARTPGTRRWRRCRYPVRRSSRKVTKARHTGTSHVHTLDVRIDRLACTLRRTVTPASPLTSCCANRPRWVRWSAGRDRSRAARAEMATTVPAPTASSLGTLTRQPASRMTTTAKAGTVASTPPTSEPKAG